MRESIIFYRGWFESIEELAKKDRLPAFEALLDYAFNDVEPDISGAPSALFKALKPQADANNRKYANGKKGGRPKRNQDETKTKPNANQDETKAEPNGEFSKPHEHVHVHDNINIKHEHVHEHDNIKHDNINMGLGSVAVVDDNGDVDDDPFNIWKKMTPDDVDAVYEVYPESGGDLIDVVAADVKQKRKAVKRPVSYILGYAKNVGWDDKADHSEAL